MIYGVLISVSEIEQYAHFGRGEGQRESDEQKYGWKKEEQY